MGGKAKENQVETENLCSAQSSVTALLHTTSQSENWKFVANILTA